MLLTSADAKPAVKLRAKAVVAAATNSPLPATSVIITDTTATTPVKYISLGSETQISDHSN